MLPRAGLTAQAGRTAETLERCAAGDFDHRAIDVRRLAGGEPRIGGGALVGVVGPARRNQTGLPPPLERHSKYSAGSDKKYSKHNTSYWQRKKYLGIGPSAHSYNGMSRQWNVSNNQVYIRSLTENIIPFEIEELSESNKFNEYVLTSLRTIWGIDILLVESEFGQLRKGELLKQIQKFINEGMIISSGNNFILTKEGKFFADRIASEMFV